MSLLKTVATNSLFIGVLLLLPLGARAALESRAAGAAYYDTALDITWLADANLAASENYGVAIEFGGGNMQGSTVTTYLAAVNAAAHLGVDTWRRPSTLVPDATCTDTPGGSPPPSTTSVGYNCTGSEMGHLFATDLNGVPGVPGITGAPFINLQQGGYWSDPLLGGSFWLFIFDSGSLSGFQSAGIGGGGGYLMLVADGDPLAPQVPSVNPVGAAVLALTLTTSAAYALRRYRAVHNT